MNLRRVPPSLQANARRVPQFVHGQFLPNPFQIIIQLTFIHSTLYILPIESAVK
jgi:hypothetical protein